MCGPLAIAFSLSHPVARGRASVLFHLMLNLGRVLSYVLVGASIGALGSVLVAGGQVAGVGSALRQMITSFTGLLLIWLGLCQICPGALPKIPFLHPLAQGPLHERFSLVLSRMSAHQRWWTPVSLGMVWGLIPCGFLYTAQIKAAETSRLWGGAGTMLAFGLGTLPMMLGVGVSASRISPDRRHQLFRLGGWLTLVIGGVTLFRTGQMAVDLTGYGALVCLSLALLARPLSQVWPEPLQYRRGLGLAAFGLSLIHTLHRLEHTWDWQWRAFTFMLPRHQWGIVLGVIGLMLLVPAAVTSFKGAQRWLGRNWRYLHLLSVPALVLSTLHCLLISAHFLGRVNLQPRQWGLSLGLGFLVALVLLLRTRWFWRQLSLEKVYTAYQWRSEKTEKG
jgi:sulfite exporter TauE/SafE